MQEFTSIPARCAKCDRPYLAWGVNPAPHTCPEDQTEWRIWHAQRVISERMDQAARLGKAGDMANRALVERDVEWWLGTLEELRSEKAAATRALLDSIPFAEITVGGDAR